MCLTSEQCKICDELWRKYEPALRTVCRLKLQNKPDDVEDIVAEVFTILCERYERGDPPNNPDGFLFGALNNLLREKYRTLKKEKAVVPLSDAMLQITPDERVLRALTEHIDDEALLDRLRGILSETDYKIIHLHYFERLQLKQIAKLCGLSELAVRQRHHRACRKLEKFLSNPCHVCLKNGT